MDTLIGKDTCGNCRFSRPVKQDLKMVECAGIPPTPVIVGMGPQGPVIALMRPNLQRSEAGCGLHKRAAALDTPVGAA